MKIRGFLELKIFLEGNVEYFAKALSIDERELPEWLSSTINVQRNYLMYKLYFSINEAKQVLTLFNTLDDFIRCLKAIYKSFSILDKVKKDR